MSWLLDLLLLRPDLVQTKLDVYQGVSEAHYQAGDLICREGGTLNRAFIISRGKAQVFRSDGTGAEVPLAQLGPGELFGGLASDGGVRQVGIRCIEEMIVLVLPRGELEPLLMALPDTRQKLSAL
jgi:CRP-like cAMP-binding protein